ncbi:hypothetical protein ACM614_21445, partial [Streptomyces sp. 12297]
PVARPVPATAASPVSFPVRPYRSAVLRTPTPGGLSTMTLMLVVTTPAVLAAASLRPRSKSRGSS